LQTEGAKVRLTDPERVGGQGQIKEGKGDTDLGKNFGGSLDGLQVGEANSNEQGEELDTTKLNREMEKLRYGGKGAEERDWA